MLNHTYHQPAEWAAHRGCFVAFPSDAELWQEMLAPAQHEFVALCKAIAQSETLHILVPSIELEVSAKAMLVDCNNIFFHIIPFGDIWLRDTAPIFVRRDDATLVAACFEFNGWGHKYLYEADVQLAHNIAQCAQHEAMSIHVVLEGGSIDTDGEGTCLTTKQCLLNRNRNPGMSQIAIEKTLQQTLGFKKILWLDAGLQHDHTDGHIDNIARFVAPSRVVCMQATDNNDPNTQVLQQIYHDLTHMHDAHNRLLDVITIPSPGLVVDDHHKILPASYLNFYIANKTVIVPTYGSIHDAEAVEKIGALFPDRQTMGLSAKSILQNGGGAFHCITQQEPL